MNTNNKTGRLTTPLLLVVDSQALQFVDLVVFKTLHFMFGAHRKPLPDCILGLFNMCTYPQKGNHIFESICASIL